MFVLVREGVYQQGIYGVFNGMQDTVDAGVEAIKKERDSYHEFCIYYIKPNQLLDSRDGIKMARIYKDKTEVKFQWFDIYGEG